MRVSVSLFPYRDLEVAVEPWMTVSTLTHMCFNSWGVPVDTIRLLKEHISLPAPRTLGSCGIVDGDTLHARLDVGHHKQAAVRAKTPAHKVTEARALLGLPSESAEEVQQLKAQAEAFGTHLRLQVAAVARGVAAESAAMRSRMEALGASPVAAASPPTTAAPASASGSPVNWARQRPRSASRDFSPSVAGVDIFASPRPTPAALRSPSPKRSGASGGGSKGKSKSKSNSKSGFAHYASCEKLLRSLQHDLGGLVARVLHDADKILDLRDAIRKRDLRLGLGRVAREEIHASTEGLREQNTELVHKVVDQRVVVDRAEERVRVVRREASEEVAQVRKRLQVAEDELVAVKRELAESRRAFTELSEASQQRGGPASPMARKPTSMAAASSAMALGTAKARLAHAAAAATAAATATATETELAAVPVPLMQLPGERRKEEQEEEEEEEEKKKKTHSEYTPAQESALHKTIALMQPRSGTMTWSAANFKSKWHKMASKTSTQLRRNALLQQVDLMMKTGKQSHLVMESLLGDMRAAVSDLAVEETAQRGIVQNLRLLVDTLPAITADMRSGCKCRCTCGAERRRQLLLIHARKEQEEEEDERLRRSEEQAQQRQNEEAKFELDEPDADGFGATVAPLSLSLTAEDIIAAGAHPLSAQSQ